MIWRSLKQLVLKPFAILAIMISKETTHPDLFKATDRVARLFNQKLKMLKQAIELQETAFDQAKADGNDEGAEKRNLSASS